jgi:GNAT superfamily N-acetyltransferase
VTRIAALDLGEQTTIVALLELQRAAYAVEAQLLGTGALPALSESADELATCGEAFLGAFDPDLVGAVSYVREGPVVDIHRLVVAPARFRRGIASRLLDALEAAEPDAQRFLVATGAANAPARTLYERRGFRATGERVVTGGVKIVDYERTR